MPSWSWTGCEGKKASIEVYARAARVELWLNGRIVGRKALKNDCLAKFSVPYEPGRLEAVSYDAQGCELGRCTLTTAGQQTQITAGPEQSSVQAGHLCYIRLRYTDEKGITKPLARGNIKVEVDGGTLVGLGNACPYHERSYLDCVADTYYGEALAIVRAGEGNSLTLTADDGMYSTAVTVPVTR